MIRNLGITVSTRTPGFGLHPFSDKGSDPAKTMTNSQPDLVPPHHTGVIYFFVLICVYESERLINNQDLGLLREFSSQPRATVPIIVRNYGTVEEHLEKPRDS